MRQRARVVALAMATILAGALLCCSAGASEVRMGGTFVMNIVEGVPGEDLYPILGNENSWSITLHDAWDECVDMTGNLVREIHAVSFEFEFYGPNADLLNSEVGSQLNQGWIGGWYFRVLHHPLQQSAYFFFGATSDGSGEGVYLSVEGFAETDVFPLDDLECPTIGAFEIDASTTVLFDHRGPSSGWFEAEDSSDLWLEVLTPLSERTWGAVKALYR